MNQILEFFHLLCEFSSNLHWISSGICIDGEVAGNCTVDGFAVLLVVLIGDIDWSQVSWQGILINDWLYNSSNTTSSTAVV